MRWPDARRQRRKRNQLRKHARVEFQTKDGPVVGGRGCLVFDKFGGNRLCGWRIRLWQVGILLSLMRLVEYGGGEIAGGRLLFDRKDAEQIDLAKPDRN